MLNVWIKVNAFNVNWCSYMQNPKLILPCQPTGTAVSLCNVHVWLKQVDMLIMFLSCKCHIVKNSAIFMKDSNGYATAVKHIQGTAWSLGCTWTNYKPAMFFCAWSVLNWSLIFSLSIKMNVQENDCYTRVKTEVLLSFFSLLFFQPWEVVAGNGLMYPACDL